MQDKEKMFLDLNSVLVKFWIENNRPDKAVKIELLERMLNWYKKMGYVTLDKQEEKKLPEGLEEAAEEYRRNSYNASLIPPTDGSTPDYGYSVIDTFKAGAKWDRVKMMERAVEGVVQDDGQFINFGDGRYIDLDPTMGLKPVFELTDGDKVKVIVISEEK